jgi:hypothetical protein
MDFDPLSASPYYSYPSTITSTGGQETSPSEQPSSGSNSPPEYYNAAASSSSDMAITKQRRKPMPRKGHTKSRRGCFSCKKRKIKCPETLPKCDNCVKSGMTCEYPRRDIAISQEATGQNPIMQPQATPTVFNINDMRYFHCFLTKAYPHLPIGADALWTLELPAQAHEVSYQRPRS